MRWAGVERDRRRGVDGIERLPLRVLRMLCSDAAYGWYTVAAAALKVMPAASAVAGRPTRSRPELRRCAGLRLPRRREAAPEADICSGGTCVSPSVWTAVSMPLETVVQGGPGLCSAEMRPDSSASASEVSEMVPQLPLPAPRRPSAGAPSDPRPTLELSADPCVVCDCDPTDASPLALRLGAPRTAFALRCMRRRNSRWRRKLRRRETRCDKVVSYRPAGSSMSPFHSGRPRSVRGVTGSRAPARALLLPFLRRRRRLAAAADAAALPGPPVSSPSATLAESPACSVFPVCIARPSDAPLAAASTAAPPPSPASLRCATESAAGGTTSVEAVRAPASMSRVAGASALMVAPDMCAQPCPCPLGGRLTGRVRTAQVFVGQKSIKALMGRSC